MTIGTIDESQRKAATVVGFSYLLALPPFLQSHASSTGRCNMICLADVAKPSQDKVPADLTLASAFSFCFLSMNVGLS
jgi:hypothetical protein